MSEIEPFVIEYHPQLKCVPWSTNDDRRINPYKRAEIIALWKEGAILAYRQYRKALDREWPFPKQKAIVHMTIPFEVNRKRDPHNYCGTVLKAAIDGLVNGGAFPDDTPEYVGHREPILVVGTMPARLEIWPEDR